METERLYRLSIPGIVLLGSTLILYLLRGGTIHPLHSLITEATVSLLIAAIISVPTVGLIISTITLMFIYFIRQYRFYINKPTLEIANIVLLRHDPLKTKIKDGNITNAIYREFYCKYQAFIRMNAGEETIKFLQRRWNFLWIHANNIIAIILSLIISCFLDYTLPVKEINKQYLIPIGIIILCYFVFAVYQVKILRKEVVEIEEESVKRIYHDSQTTI